MSMEWAPKKVLKYLGCERTNRSLDEHIIEDLRNGNSALHIEEYRRLSGDQFSEHDRRIIRLLEIAYALGYHLRTMKYGPEGVYRNLIRNENFKVWFPFAQLSPKDQLMIIQLILMLACLGYGESAQEWIAKLFGLSRSFGNDDVIRDLALSGLENADEGGHKKDKSGGERSEKKTSQTISALWDLENELFRSEIMEEWIKPHGKGRELTKILMGLMDEESGRDRLKSRNLLGGLDDIRDQKQAKQKRYKHVWDYAKKHWHNAPVTGKRQELPEHTELRSLMSAYEAGRAAVGRSSPGSPCSVMECIELNPEFTSRVLDVHDPTGIEEERHGHSQLHNIAAVKERRPGPQLHKHEDESNVWKDITLDQACNTPYSDGSDSNQTATDSELMEDIMSASLPPRDFFDPVQEPLTMEEQLHTWKPSNEHDHSLEVLPSEGIDSSYSTGLLLCLF